MKHGIINNSPFEARQWWCNLSFAGTILGASMNGARDVGLNLVAASKERKRTSDMKPIGMQIQRLIPAEAKKYQMHACG